MGQFDLQKEALKDQSLSIQSKEFCMPEIATIEQRRTQFVGSHAVQAAFNDTWHFSKANIAMTNHLPFICFFSQSQSVNGFKSLLPNPFSFRDFK